MDLVDIPDFSFIDIDELGMRPRDWVDEGNAMEFDGTGHDFFDQEKPLHFDPYKSDFRSLKSGKQFTVNETNAIISDDDDDFLNDSQYDIDPETGEKIFREAVISSSPSLTSSSASDSNWIEDYLSSIPVTTASSSSSNYQIPVAPTRTTHFSAPYRQTEWKTPQWSSEHSFLGQSMFSNTFMDDKRSIMYPLTSPMSIPLVNGNNSNHLFSVSVDDEHSTSSSSNGSRGGRYRSSLESESTTRDSESLFDGHLIEPKLEKLEHDESNMPHLFHRRSSTRSISQGQQDEEMLRRCGIPLTVTDITQSSTEDYNRHLANLMYLTPDQIHLIKDIRRRGKNKIAAQNCRKRKANSVESLLDEVDDLKRIKHELEEKKRSFQKQIDQTRHQYEYLHQQVLPNRQLPPAIFVK